MKDNRSKRLVLVCHCILNQNSKVEGIARYPGTFLPAAELLIRSEAGVYQLPCPEMTYLGMSRWSAVKAQYSSPFFRRHCQALAESMMDEMEDYTTRGYTVAGLVGMDGSPSCGVDFTQQALGEPWGGRVEKIPARQYVSGKGTFIDILEKEAERRGLSFPLMGLPENEAMGSIEASLEKMERLLKREGF